MYFPGVDESLRGAWTSLESTYINDYRASIELMEATDQARVDEVLGILLSYCQCLPYSDSSNPWHKEKTQVRVIVNPLSYDVLVVVKQGTKTGVKGYPRAHKGRAEFLVEVIRAFDPSLNAAQINAKVRRLKAVKGRRNLNRRETRCRLRCHLPDPHHVHIRPREKVKKSGQPKPEWRSVAKACRRTPIQIQLIAWARRRLGNRTPALPRQNDVFRQFGARTRKYRRRASRFGEVEIRADSLPKARVVTLASAKVVINTLLSLFIIIICRQHYAVSNVR